MSNFSRYDNIGYIYNSTKDDSVMLSSLSYENNDYNAEFFIFGRDRDEDRNRWRNMHLINFGLAAAGLGGALYMQHKLQTAAIENMIANTLGNKKRLSNIEKTLSDIASAIKSQNVEASG